MKNISLETLRATYRLGRRENFAASQRLEGILTPLTRSGNAAPPSKAELLKKYAPLKLRR